MPYSEYVSADGQIRVERDADDLPYPPPATIEVDGRTLARVLPCAPGRRSRKSAGWPLECDALGVQPDQVQAAMAFNARHGVTGVEYDAEGTPTVKSAGEYARFADAWGMFHRNAGYRDATPRGRHKYLPSEE